VRTVLAACVVAGVVAAPVAVRAHEASASRHVVVQVERDAVVVLVGYQEGAGAAELALLSHAKQQGSQGVRALLHARAVASLTVRIDGRRASASSVETRVFVDPPGSDRLAIAVLATYALPAAARRVEIGVTGERTRITWVDRTACARSVTSRWRPTTWIQGVARLLLDLGGPCASPGSPASSSSPPPAIGSTTPTRRATASRRSSG
jgi:hypothetical protein